MRRVMVLGVGLLAAFVGARCVDDGGDLSLTRGGPADAQVPAPSVDAADAAVVADSGSAADAGEAPSPPGINGVLMKVWQLQQPHWLTSSDTAPVAVGPVRPRSFGGGQGNLRYITRLGDSLILRFQARTGDAALFTLPLSAGPDAVPTPLATVVGSALGATPSPDGRTLAYWDAGRVWTVRPGQAPVDLGPWADGSLRRLLWTADSQFVVASDDTVNVAFGSSMQLRLPDGLLLGVGEEAVVYLRTTDRRAVRIDLSVSPEGRFLTPTSERVMDFLGVADGRLVLGFEHPTSDPPGRRIGAVDDAGALTWLSPPNATATAVSVGRQVFTVETAGGTSAVFRTDVNGANRASVVRPWRDRRITVLGADDGHLYACDDRSPLLSVPLAAGDAEWTLRATNLTRPCAFYGITDDHVILSSFGPSLSVWRMPKDGNVAEAVLPTVTAILPEGLLSMPDSVESQLVVLQDGLRRPLGPPASGLQVDIRPDAGPVAGFSDDALVARTSAPDLRWWAHSLQDDRSWPLSPPGVGGRLMAVDPPWVVIEVDDANVPSSVYALHIDGRFGEAGATLEPLTAGTREPAYDPSTNTLWSLTGRHVVSRSLDDDLSILYPFPLNSYGLLAVPNDRVYAVAPNGIYSVGGRTRQPYAELSNLSGRLTASADGRRLIALEVTTTTAVPRPVGAWSLPTARVAGIDPVQPRRFDGVPVPTSIDLQPELLAVPQDGLLTRTDLGIQQEPLDPTGEGVLLVPGLFEPAAERVVYGQGWYAIAEDGQVTTYAVGGTPTVRDAPARITALLGASGAYGVAAVQQPGLWFFEGAGEAPLVRLTPEERPHLLPDRPGQAAVVPLPSGAGVLYLSDAGGDVSLYVASFEANLEPSARVQPLSAIDDAEEVWIGFLP